MKATNLSNISRSRRGNLLHSRERDYLILCYHNLVICWKSTLKYFKFNGFDGFPSSHTVFPNINQCIGCKWPNKDCRWQIDKQTHINYQEIELSNKESVFVFSLLSFHEIDDNDVYEMRNNSQVLCHAILSKNQKQIND